MKQGKASIRFEQPPEVVAAASVVGKKEGEGPLGAYFDEIEQDPMAGQDNWEAAESELQKRAAETAIRKAAVGKSRIRYIFAGDLLGQGIATSFGMAGLGIPVFGLYGACSTMGESLHLGAMTVAGNCAEYVLCATSSHFGSAEKQFRFPLEYGNQRPLSATWTVTGAGAVVLGRQGGTVRITGATAGKIVDYGIKDSMNMGAAMAPAAADTIYRNLVDFGLEPAYYDKIITGDLGTVGKEILLQLLKDKNVDIEKQHMDCGLEIYDNEKQDTHAGGSGCGCSATVLAAMILPQMEKRKWRRVLFVPTGALLSTVSFNEGQSVPGIAHGISLEY